LRFCRRLLRTIARLQKKGTFTRPNAFHIRSEKQQHTPLHMPTWYDKLKKPWFSPPKKVFGPAWAVLYLFIVSALVTYYFTPVKPHYHAAGIILVIHFTASFSWTQLFFTRKKILLAFVDILVIDTTLIALIILLTQSSLLSAFLLLPYLGWCLFASALNWSIYRLNPGESDEDS